MVARTRLVMTYARPSQPGVHCLAPDLPGLRSRIRSIVARRIHSTPETVDDFEPSLGDLSSTATQEA
jgi:hypothetical protein